MVIICRKIYEEAILREEVLYPENLVKIQWCRGIGKLMGNL